MGGRNAGGGRDGREEGEKEKGGQGWERGALNNYMSSNSYIGGSPKNTCIISN